MKFDCIHCGQRLEVEDYEIGETLDCPACGHPVSVPAPESGVDDPPPVPPAIPVPAEKDACRYWAFISYSSRDRAWGEWLHRSIETYGIPAEFVNRHRTPVGPPVPRRFQPVFRDRDELPASSDLGGVIREALRASRYLIVICSPNAARSTWVNEEIATFLTFGRRDRIFAIIVEGEPNAGGDRECFPPALRMPFEPIAADARSAGDGRTNAKLKLLAGMLGVNFDALKRRDVQRQKRRRILMGATTGLLVTLATIAIHQTKTAAEQGRTAEKALKKASEEEASAARRLYAADLLKVRDAWERSDMLRFRELLQGQMPERTGGVDLRGFEWFYWQDRGKQGGSAKMPGHAAVCFSPDGSRMAMVGADGRVVVRNAADGEVVRTYDGRAAFVNTISFSPDGGSLAAAGETVDVWDTATGRHRFELQGGCTAVCYSADGRTLASGSPDSRVLLWDAESGRMIRALDGDGAPVRSVCFSPDGKRLAATGPDKPYRALVWAVDSGRVLLTIRNAAGAVCFSPDGKRLASGSSDRFTFIWDAETGEKLHQFLMSGPNGAVTAVAFSPDGLRVASGGKHCVVRIWDASGSDRDAPTLSGHTGEILGLAFSPDGRRLASAGIASDSVRTWDTAGGPVRIPFYDVNRVCFSPDNKHLAAAGSSVALFDADTGKTALELNDYRNPSPGGGVKGLCYSPDGRRFFSCIGGGVAIRDAATGRQIQTVSGANKRAPGELACSLDGKRIAGADWGGDVEVWDATDGRSLMTLKNAGQHVSFSPDGQRIATGDASGNIRLWDAATGKSLSHLPGHASRVLGVCFSPDGACLASCGEDGMIYLRSGSSGQVLFPLKGHKDAVKAIGFSPDGRRLVSGGRDRTLRIWDVQSGLEVLAVPGFLGDIESVAFSADGKRIGVGAGRMIDIWKVDVGRADEADVRSDSAVAIWDAATGRRLITLDGCRMCDRVLYSPDGRWLATTGDSDFSIKIWDAAKGRQLLSLRAHPNKVEDFCFSPDGRQLVAGYGFAKEVRRWDLDSGRELPALGGHRAEIDCIAISPDGENLAVGCHDRSVKVWDIDRAKESYTLTGLEHAATRLCFSPDGKYLATGSWPVKLWSARRGQLIASMESDGASFAFTPDSRRLAVGGQMFSTSDGERVLQRRVERGDRCLLSPDGRLLFIGSDQGVVVLDTDRGRERVRLDGVKVHRYGFSPDSRRLATGTSQRIAKDTPGNENAVTVWSLDDGKALHTFRWRGGDFMVKFSPDGKRIVTGGRWQSEPI